MKLNGTLFSSWLILIFSALTVTSKAQSNADNSISSYLERSETNLATSQYDSAQYWYELALKLKEKISRPEYYYAIVDYQNRQKNGDSTLKYLRLWEGSMTDDPSHAEVASLYFSWGSHYYYNVRFDSALNYLQKALISNEETFDLDQRQVILIRLLEASRRCKQYDVSRKYGRRAIKLAEQQSDDPSLAISCLFYSRTLDNISYQDSSFLYLTKAVSIAEKIGSSFLLDHCYNDLAGYYYRNHNFKKALDYDKKSLEQLLLYDPDNKHNLSVSFSSLARGYAKLGHTDSALHYFRKSNEIIKDLEQPYRRLEILTEMSNFFRDQEDYKGAYDHLMENQQLKDSLFVAENAARFQELQAKYESEKNLNEIERLRLMNREKQTFNYLILTIGMTVILIGGAVFWVLLYRKKKEQEMLSSKATTLEELNRMKSQFFVNAAHELRSPLTLVLGPIQDLIHQKIKNDKELKKALQGINTNAQKLLDQVEDILELAKLENEKLEINLNEVPLKDFMEKTVAAFETQAQSRNVALKLHYALKNEQLVRIDEKKVRTILYNLISNALKFSDQGGVISVLVKRGLQKEGLRLEVTDTGRGIPPNDLPHIFDRYYQSETNMKEGGTGIGLALAAELASLLSGTLKVESIFEEGSTFTLELPAVIVKESWDEEEKTVVKGSDLSYQNPPTPRILIVEDHPEMLDYISNILNGIGEVTCARNGEEALVVIKDHQPDLVVTDLMMPRKDGFGLILELKSDPQLATIPVIVVTARTEPHDFVKLFTVGIDDFIPKPFESQELLARVNNVLRNSLNRKIGLPYLSGKSLNETLSPNDREWIKKVGNILKGHVANPGFSIASLANELALSERQLRRKIKSITGMSPNSLFREIKLQTAQQLIESGKYATLTEVALKVGFESRNHFVSLYKERFGSKPLEMVRKAGESG